MRDSKTWNRWMAVGFCAAALGMGIWLSNTVAQPTPAPTQPATTRPFVQATDALAAGKYITQIAGCNDCHTPGWMETGGANVPEENLMTGSALGFRGPWGTTYASNLRIYSRQFTEDDFVKVLRARNTRPPMPWNAIHAMTDPDLRAVYKYLTSLKPVGKPAPAYVPPGVEPKGPYVVMDPSVAPKAYGDGAATAPTTTSAPASAPTK